ncbi:Vegetative catalase [Eubacteriaceae bacterium CHKCI005]|nr:Vegetative catalase [Eubacteriaceae bacterium CHKCI005]
MIDRQEPSSFHEMIERYNRQIQEAKRRPPVSEPPSCPNPEPQESSCPPPPCPPQKPQPLPDRESVASPSRRPAHHSAPSLPEKPCDKVSCDDKTDFSQTAGIRGPVLLQDSILHETLATFVNHKPLERVLHVKGYGAFGYFQPYQSMSKYTKACFLQDPAQRTPTFTRFSLMIGSQDTPDSCRNVRGFSTKFYTKDGIFDLLCNQIPVFFLRDAMRFPEAIAALSPSPVNNLPDPSLFWDFIARTPQAMHMLTWLYSDVGTSCSFQTMGGHGVNTFVWCNAEGKRWYVKYHWIPLAGERYIDRHEAQQTAGQNPYIAGQSLYHSLARGQVIEYELRVQLMDPADENNVPFDPLDDTKIWSETQYPLLPVGLLTLEHNPDDYRSQVEQSAFSPANLIEGIELSNDAMLQGRSFIYWDAQRRRLGPGFRDLSINCTPGWSPARSFVTSGEGMPVSGVETRACPRDSDPFTQAGERYRSLDALNQEHLVDNIASELYAMPKHIQKPVLDSIQKCDQAFAQHLVRQMEIYC